MNKLIAIFVLCASSAAFADGEAKNIIFFLGDGMGPAVVTGARLYKGGVTAQLTMETFEHTARVKTYSNDAQVTDSAPSMAAYMTGVKMNNQVISMTPDTVYQDPVCDPNNGKPVPTILELAKAAGKAVGIVTTTEVMDATPAATFGHICNRNIFPDLAKQMVPSTNPAMGYNTALGDGINVIFGGDLNKFLPWVQDTRNDGRRDGRDLIAELTAQNYVFAHDTASFNAIPATATKVIGLFTASSYLTYEYDRKPELEPSLKDMASKALDVLENANGGKGYFLMVEGGRIDHALHNTNAKRAFVEANMFDQTIKMALDRVDLKNTLLVVTADHDHTMVINGYPKRDNGILDLVYGYKDGKLATDADGQPYTVLSFGNGDNRPGIRGALTSRMVTDPNYHQEAVTLRNGGGKNETHGGSDVMLMATGAGSFRFKGTMVNTKVFGLLKAAFGL
jgi:alkaline phosphatase